MAGQAMEPSDARRSTGQPLAITPVDAHRYSRQELFRPIGSSGQVRLATARVAVVGLGALGSVAATQLVRAGVGFVRLLDRDIVELSNLQRQTLFTEADAAAPMPKAVAAAVALGNANSEVELDPVVADVTAANAMQWLGDVDVIVDGTDNFQTRRLLNEVAVSRGVAFAYGGAVSSYGTAAFLRPRGPLATASGTPCLVCLFGESSEGGHDTCDTVGVLAPVVAMVASLQVVETLKYLTGNATAYSDALTYVDVWRNDFRSVAFASPAEDCPCCGRRQFPHLQRSSDALTVSLCGRRTIQVRPEPPADVVLAAPPQVVQFAAVASRLQAVGSVRWNAQLLRCDLGAIQITLFADGRALIHGIDDPVQARSIYARYIGS